MHTDHPTARPGSAWHLRPHAHTVLLSTTPPGATATTLEVQPSCPPSHPRFSPKRLAIQQMHSRQTRTPSAQPSGLPKGTSRGPGQRSRDPSARACVCTRARALQGAGSGRGRARGGQGQAARALGPGPQNGDWGWWAGGAEVRREGPLRAAAAVLTEQQQLELPAGVPLVPAELPLNLVVDPPGFLGLLAQAARHDGLQSHSFKVPPLQPRRHPLLTRAHTHPPALAPPRQRWPPSPRRPGARPGRARGTAAGAAATTGATRWAGGAAAAGGSGCREERGRRGRRPRALAWGAR